MAAVVAYTIWNLETREVYAFGEGVEGSVSPGIGFAVHYGGKFDERYVFDDDDQPVLRDDDGRPRDPSELPVQINRERARRIEAGTVINGVRVTGRDEDTRNLTNLALAAQLRLAGGDTATVTVFRDGDNIDHELTPMQVLGLWQQSAAYVSSLYAASWALKGMDPIPQDISDHRHWP